MAYSIEQAEKALRDKYVSDLLKKYRMMTHEECVNDVLRYGLPYRVLWDYKEKTGPFEHKEAFEIELNPYYPHPCEPTTAGAAGRFIKWGFDDEMQIKAWKKYFTRFLLPYAADIESWNSFDLFGNNTHDQEETERFKAFLLSALYDYGVRPADVDLLRMKTLQDYDLYDVSVFNGGYMWRYDLNENNNDDIMKHPQALEIMEKEREYELKRIERQEEHNKQRERQEETRSPNAAPPIPIMPVDRTRLEIIDKLIEEIKLKTI